MLFYNTIERPTLSLLKKIQSICEFRNSRLVGGTALALQIGHRRSIDLDFFGNLEIDRIKLNKILDSIGHISILKQSDNIHIFVIDGIKVDFVNYPYPWLKEPFVEDDIVLADTEDISAMKLSAVTNRGTKKDFIDIYYLLRKYSLGDMLDFYRKKYSDGSQFLVMKSLTYFDDAEGEQSPYMFEDIEWEDIKNTIQKAVADYSEL